MSEEPFIVKSYLTQQDIADVMVGAIEGGSNYWLGSVTPPYEGHEGYSKGEAYGPGMIERTFKSDDGDYSGVLSRDHIQRGLTLMAEKYPRMLANIIEENYDAGDSDVFLQCVVFNDVIYG